nr:MAG TPA: crystallin beta/gamma motif-containing protein [Caudoviricetes sp.]
MDLTTKQDENFATSLNPNARFGEQAPSSAKFNYTQAVASGKSPQQVASDVKLADAVGVAPEVIGNLDVAGKAEQQANALDWSRMHQETPVLMQMMNDPTFAAEVSDDPRQAGMWERLWWKIAPRTGRQDGLSATVRNAVARGGYGLVNGLPLLGNERVLEDCRTELQGLDDAAQSLKDGKSVAEVFGSDEDPSGEGAYARFLVSGEARKKELMQRMYKAAASMAWANGMKQLFPHSAATEELFQAQTAGQAITTFLQNPVSIALDVGLESLVQQAPQLAALAIGAAAGGIGAAAIGQGVASYNLERGARLADAMGEYGLDSLNAKDIVTWYGSPDYRGQYALQKAKAEDAASAVAFWDAAAGGLAAAGRIVPKGFLGMGERASKIASVGTQAILQGAMGSAGEASAQYITEGKITSWADVVAEFAGEFVSSPIDVAAAALGRTTERRTKAALAQEFARQTAQLEQYAKVSPLLANDPKTTAEYVKNIKAQTQLPDLYVDVQSLHQSGQDDVVAGASPELAERYQQALLKGESMKVSPEELLTVLAPRDTNNALAEVVHPEGMPSLVEAQSLEQTAAQETSERLAQTLEGVTGDFATSSANVGKQVETMLDEAYGENTDVKDGGMAKSARQIMTTYLQTLFTTTAKDLGVLPEQVFAEYGPKSVLTPADATRTAEGKLQVTSDRAKQLFAQSLRSDQKSFSQHGTAKENVHRGLKAIEALLAKKQSVTDAMTYKGSPVDFDYGYEGDTRIDARGHRKGEHGFLHLLEARWRKDGLSEEEIRILLDDLVYTIAYGKADANSAKDRTVLRLKIHGGECLAVLKKPKDRNAWVLTGYYLNPATGAATQGLVKSGATQSKPTTTRLGSGAVATDSLTILEQSVLTSKALRQIGLERKLFSPIQPRHLPQGSIGAWFPDVRAIATWTGANRSTFLHETGHMFLDMRTKIAVKLKAKKDSGVELTKGEQHLLDTLEATMKWLGTDLESFSKMDIDAQRPYQEKFARTYEAYLMEGNAPSKGLTKLFRSFSGWLRGVYRVITNIPGAEISPEVRELFDFLFVASTEVEAARLRRAQFERYNDPQLAAIAQEIGEDFADLQEESVDKAMEEMHSRLQKASQRIAKMRKGQIADLTDEAQRVYNEIYDRVWEEVMKAPEYQAHVALTSGVNGIKPKLTMRDLNSVEPKLTEAQIKMLEDMGMVGSNPKGVNAQMVAEKNGFDSLNTMVFALLHLGDPVEHVRDLTTTEMLEKHAELASPESIEQSADAAIFNDARLRILHIEAMTLSRALGKKGDLYTELRKGAKTAIGQIRVAKLADEGTRHAAESARNGRESERARNAGDIKTAAAAKVRELYQGLMRRLIEVRLAEIRRAMKFFARFKGVKTLKLCDTKYLMAIQHILDKVGIAPFPAAGVNQRQSLASFLGEIQGIALKEDEGVSTIDADPDFVTKIDSGELKLENMTSDQFDVLEGLIRQIYAHGKAWASIEVEGKLVALEEAQQDLANGILEHAQERGKKPLENVEKSDDATSNLLKRIGLAHRRIPSLFNCMEGVMPGYGRFFKYIVRRFDECGNREAVLKNEISKALFDVLSPLFKDFSKSKARYYENVKASFTKQQIFVMALNMGNEGNIQRLIDNSDGYTFMNGRKLTQADVMSLISQTLTADEIRRVQTVWDLFSEMQKEIEAKEIRKNGRAPTWVQPQPIAMASVDGQVVELKGGYYPIVYDRKASARGATLEESKSVLQELKGAQGQASTWKGFLKDRARMVKMQTPITLTLRGAFEGFENTIHDVCWDEWVTDTRRLFSRNSVLSKTILNYYGAETLTAINQWIKDTAVGKSNQGRMEDGIATLFRKNISLVGIGFNLVTAAIQTVGITQTVVALGGKWTLSGLGDMLTMTPMGAYKFAASKSLLIPDRLRTQFREIAEIQRYTATGGNRVWEGFSRMAYMPVALVQMLVDLPTWLGAYNRALAEGKAETEAIAMADRLLIEAQGSGRFQDLSGAERGNPWAQLFTVFYTFFNTTYNLARLTMETKGKLAAARDLMLLLVAQPVIETFVREALKVQPPDDDDDAYWDRMQSAMLANTIDFNMSLIVGLREAASIADVIQGSPVRYQGPTGTKKITDVLAWSAKAAKEWASEDEIDPAFIRQSITVFAEITGKPIPVVPVNRYLRGKQAIDEGDTTDWKAYLFGYSKR